MEKAYRGYTGQLAIRGDKIIITRKGFGGFLSRGPMSGDKEVPIKNITAIQFRKAGMLSNGFIQFSILGEVGHKGGVLTKVNDENTVFFTKRQSSEFSKAKEEIEKLMEQAKNSSPIESKFSSADELAKFAKLRDDGIISEEEFNQKKNELLG
jgi:hypothetical protein